MQNMNDPFGKAVLDFLMQQNAGKLEVLSEDFDADEIPVKYLFRSFKDMPDIEQTALRHCKGKVLDIGAGSGCHTLWLQKNGIDVTALEQSDFCVQAMQKQGINNILGQDFFAPLKEQFDTLLLLMNGTGIAGTLDNFPLFLSKLKELLSDGGQVLIDSSNLIYLFEEEEDGTATLPLNGKYYGELEYKFKYNNMLSDVFPWLFIDQDLFSAYAQKAGFDFEIVLEGANYDYLARLTVNTI